MKSKLQDVFDIVELVDVLDSKDSANLAVLNRPELGITFTKVRANFLVSYPILISSSSFSTAPLLEPDSVREMCFLRC